jgi:hypothetical protein
VVAARAFLTSNEWNSHRKKNGRVDAVRAISTPRSRPLPRCPSSVPSVCAPTASPRRGQCDSSCSESRSPRRPPSVTSVQRRRRVSRLTCSSIASALGSSG